MDTKGLDFSTLDSRVGGGDNWCLVQSRVDEILEKTSIFFKIFYEKSINFAEKSS